MELMLFIITICCFVITQAQLKSIKARAKAEQANLDFQIGVLKYLKKIEDDLEATKGGVNRIAYPSDRAG